MKKLISSLFLIIILLGILITNSFALQTYVGVTILNITDEFGYSCANEVGYNSSGRIQAFSTEHPTYPIYFELSYASNSSVFYTATTTSTEDYGIGDTFWATSAGPVDLDSGTSYNLFFDIDMIKVHLDFGDYSAFTASADDMYYTVGYIDVDIDYWYEDLMTSDSGGCQFNTGRIGNGLGGDGTMFSKTKANTDHSCITDTTNNNCDSAGVIGIPLESTSSNNLDYRIDSKYDNLRLTSVGNFNISFTMP